MKLLRRALITVAVTVAIIIVCLYWIGPVALSFYAARKAPAVARIVPTELQDHSISTAPGIRLSYFGYEFEVPWDDLDESKTKLYPKDKPVKTRVVLDFRSGLRLMVGSIPPREMATGFASGELGVGKVPPQSVDLLVGPGSAASDYAFYNNVYEFTPDKMHYWSLSEKIHYRESILLMIKSIMPSGSAETGILRVQNHDLRGFQQGDPAKHPEGLILSLYSEDGAIEFIFSQRDYRNPLSLTQPEINRIIQSLHKVSAARPLALGQSSDH